MRIDVNDPRANEAVRLVEQKHNPTCQAELERIFEEHYHCKIFIDPNDYFCTTGHLDISEEKYQTWFILQFGEGNDKSV